jgi:plastocyanin
MRIFGAMLILGTVFILSACASLPATSRTGAVHDVIITEEKLSPEDLIAHVGDEVRWVNRRPTTVWVYFFEDSLDEISCQNGLASFWGHEEVAKIEPNQSASVCFAKEDAISYSVQNEPTILAGSTAGATREFNIPVSVHGAIIVEAPPHKRPPK